MKSLARLLCLYALLMLNGIAALHAAQPVPALPDTVALAQPACHDSVSPASLPAENTSPACCLPGSCGGACLALPLLMGALVGSSVAASVPLSVPAASWRDPQPMPAWRPPIPV